MFKLYRLDVFSPLHTNLIILFFYTIFKYLLMYLDLAKNSLETFESTNFVTTLIILQFIMIFFFYNIFKFQNYDKYINFTKKNFSFDFDKCSGIRSTNIIIITIFIILYEIYYKIIGYSFFNSNLAPVVLKNMAGNSPIAYIFLKQFADTLILIWTLILAYYVVIFKKYTLSFFFLIIVISYVAIFNGSRGTFVFGVILPIIIIYNGFKKRIGIINLSILFFTIIITLGTLDTIRQVNEINFVNILDVIKTIPEDYSKIVLRILDRRFDSYYPNLLIVFDNIEKFDFRYGFDYINIFLQMIPRALWEDKPLSLVREVNNILVIQSVGGTGLPSIFEAWINFGILGLVFNAIMASFVLVLFQKIYLYGRNHHEIIIFILGVKLGFSLVHRFFISPGITHNSSELIIGIINYIVAIWFIKYLLYKKFTIKS